MRKFIIVLLAFLLAFSAAAESDVAAMATDDLVALRDAIDHELARRSKTGDSAQVVDVDGILFSIDSVYVGTGNDDVPAVCILFSVSNTSDASKQLMYDIGCDILQDGTLLDGTAFRSDSYSGPSAINSGTAVIAPGVVNMKICSVGALSGQGENFSVILSRKHTHAGEDPYCGTLSFILSDYIED